MAWSTALEYPMDYLWNNVRSFPPKNWHAKDSELELDFTHILRHTKSITQGKEVVDYLQR